MPATTLILGGGFGGVSTAVNLRRLAPKDHRIVLIDKLGQLVIGATKPWVMLGEAQTRSVIHSIEPLKAKGIEVIRAEVEAIDPASKKVRTSRGEFSGDFLVIALGADYDMAAVPGLSDAAQEFYTLEGAIRLRSALDGFAEGNLVHLIARAPFKCPPAPYEGAFLVHDFLRRKGRLSKVKESIVTVEGAPMATAGPDVGTFVKEELAKRSIDYLTLRKTSRIDSDAKKIVFEDGTDLAFDLLIAVPPHKVPKVIANSGLGGPNGWIPVDPKTLAIKDREGVYALGDVAVVSLPGRFKPDVPLVLPKAGTLADRAGQAVATQITHKVDPSRPLDEFDGKGFCYIELGDMHAMRGDGDFFAMPHPVMARKVPDMQQYQDKKKWIDGWLKEHHLVP